MAVIKPVLMKLTIILSKLNFFHKSVLYLQILQAENV